MIFWSRAERAEVFGRVQKISIYFWGAALARFYLPRKARRGLVGGGSTYALTYSLNYPTREVASDSKAAANFQSRLSDGS